MAKRERLLFHRPGGQALLVWTARLPSNDWRPVGERHCRVRRRMRSAPRKTQANYEQLAHSCLRLDKWVFFVRSPPDAGCASELHSAIRGVHEAGLAGRILASRVYSPNNGDLRAQRPPAARMKCGSIAPHAETQNVGRLFT